MTNELAKTYLRLFETEDGKKVLKDLNSFCYLTSSVFNTDPMKMAYSEGARSVALYIKRLMEMKEDSNVGQS